MALDFSALHSLTEPLDIELICSLLPSITVIDEEDNIEEYRVNSGLAKLEREAELNRDERDRARAVYKQYQENITKSGEVRTEIIKGAMAGEPAEVLLLKASKVISLLTGDSVFYKEMGRIYGKS